MHLLFFFVSETIPIMRGNTFKGMFDMLVKTILYNLMTVNQLGKRVDKIKKRINNEEIFDKRLDLLEELAVIMSVLVRRHSHDVAVMKYTVMKLDKLKALVK